jgi:hypothetical protein
VRRLARGCVAAALAAAPLLAGGAAAQLTGDLSAGDLYRTCETGLAAPRDNPGSAFVCVRRLRVLWRRGVDAGELCGVWPAGDEQLVQAFLSAMRGLPPDHLQLHADVALAAAFPCPSRRLPANPPANK